MIWQADIIWRFWKTKKLGNQTLPSIFEAIVYIMAIEYPTLCTSLFISLGSPNSLRHLSEHFLILSFLFRRAFPTNKETNKN